MPPCSGSPPAWHGRLHEYLPSTTRSWWSSDTDEQEERRIAYVVMSRTAKRLVLCAEPKNLQSLEAEDPEFVGPFREITLVRLEIECPAPSTVTCFSQRPANGIPDKIKQVEALA